MQTNIYQGEYKTTIDVLKLGNAVQNARNLEIIKFDRCVHDVISIFRASTENIKLGI